MLTGLRWQVREAEGGAEAWGEAMDSTCPRRSSSIPGCRIWTWPNSCAIFASFPDVDLVTPAVQLRMESAPGPHRQELLYALRRIQETDTAAWNTAPILDGTAELTAPASTLRFWPADRKLPHSGARRCIRCGSRGLHERNRARKRRQRPAVGCSQLRHRERPVPELIGNAPCMLESQPARSAGGAAHDAGADRRADGLGQGTGRRGAAPALHAQPQAICRHQLRGHSRGAAGSRAVRPHPGRIYGRRAGTRRPHRSRRRRNACFWTRSARCRWRCSPSCCALWRCGELQRVGDNETVKVDVRIIAATHRPLGPAHPGGQFSRRPLLPAGGLPHPHASAGRAR